MDKWNYVLSPKCEHCLRLLERRGPTGPTMQVVHTDDKGDRHSFCSNCCMLAVFPALEAKIPMGMKDYDPYKDHVLLVPARAR